MMTQAVYSPRYCAEIGTHIFQTIKYQKLALALTLGKKWSLVEPEPALWKNLRLVHTKDYIRKVRAGMFTADELAKLELPWSPGVVESFRLMSGGTLLAARHAKEFGLGVNLGGGFHHAFANHGEGFCLFNDIAVAIRVLQEEQVFTRAAVVDCDVHHGNGTAMIFNGDKSVFTLSIHQQHNYPMFKPRSSLDIGLLDGTDSSDYLTDLRQAMVAVVAFQPEIVFYLAGAGPYKDDQLGGLNLTMDGLRERDRTVFAKCRESNIPVVTTLAGGYARDIDDTVAIHQSTVEEIAAQVVS